ncbi:unnamed protein product [Pleuronectes platessa]|uniref:Uncharacterized protein n=1 Tax=Pleuronectes platessa TaxID=8262 RepID=A0A9N7V3F5_PLEPL|nr:unnamed protein product [Pleuronectes platessa]
MKPTEWLSEADRRACSNRGHSQDGGWLPFFHRSLPPQHVSSKKCPPGMGQLLKKRRRDIYFRFRGGTLCSSSLLFGLILPPPHPHSSTNSPRPLPVTAPQASPPPPPPPPASDSTSAGERSTDGCHRWAFPLELPASAQCVLGRVRSQASP